MARKSILIVGASGFLGSYIASSLSGELYDVWKTTRGKESGNRELFLDLRESPHSFFDGNELHFDLVIMCAGITSIAKCEETPVQTRLVNVTHTYELIREFVRRGSFVMCFSSTAVFDGSRPFSKITDATSPLSEYGRQKADLETLLTDLKDQVAVVRISKIVNKQMGLFHSWIDEVRQGRPIKPFSDMYFSPVFITVVFQAIQNILALRLGGIHHISADNDLSYAEAAGYLIDKKGYDTALVHPVPAASSGITVAARYSALDCVTLQQMNFPIPSVFDALDKFLLGK